LQDISIDATNNVLYVTTSERIMSVKLSQ